ncbi:MAG: hypothetical protein JWM98_1508, partial [Thermoleophilia bacterium]|nr:hypothetical protein [Thermoleophilia bacterium]
GGSSSVGGAQGPGGKVDQTGGHTAVKAGGPAAPAAVSHTSDHGTVLAATSTSLTLRDDMGVTQTFQIRPQDLANIDLPHLLEKHVKTGKTLDLVYGEENGVKYATGYSHPPSAPTNPPTPPSKVPHGAIHGTVAALTDTKLSLRDDNGVVTDYAITDANRATMDLEHLRGKHLPTGKALNLVFTEKDGVRQAISYNHPAAPPAATPPVPAR